MSPDREEPVDASIRLITHFDAVDAPSADDLAGRLADNAHRVADEPGSLAYEVLRDLADPAAVCVVETWATRQDAERHERLVATNGALAAIAPLLRIDPATRTWVPVNDTRNDAVHTPA